MTSQPMPPQDLPPDDLPPAEITDLDAGLRRQLELSTSRHFFEACDGPTQSLLMECRWTICILEVLTLIIYCPDALINWRVLGHLGAIAERLAPFSDRSKIRVYPPSGKGDPFDMRVDERSAYRDYS